jgi:hypothetical protein
MAVDTFMPFHMTCRGSPTLAEMIFLRSLVLQAARYPELWRDGVSGFDAVM